MEKQNIFLIKKLWIDPMENRDAYGYSPYSYVHSKEEAEQIHTSEYVNVSEHPWPLQFAWGLAVDEKGEKITNTNIAGVKGAKVPRFTYEEVKSHF